MDQVTSDPHSGRIVRWLVLHDLLDTSAPWLMRQWRARLGPAADSLLAVDTLTLNRHVRQVWHLDSTGQSRGLWHITVPGQPAALVDTSQLLGVLNRHQPCRAPLHGTDAEYKLMERHASLLAWLHALGVRVLNRPSPENLGGPLPPLLRLRMVAKELGLPIAAVHAHSGAMDDEGAHGRQVIVLTGNGRLWGPDSGYLPPALHAPALRLTEVLGYDILGLQFCINAKGLWLFAGLQPTPDLQSGGNALAERLAERMDMPMQVREFCI